MIISQGPEPIKAQNSEYALSINIYKNQLIWKKYNNMPGACTRTKNQLVPLEKI
jgi:hypothetical protein